MPQAKDLRDALRAWYVLPSRELSLVGLSSWDSISLSIICLVGLLFYCSLTALAYFIGAASSSQKGGEDLEQADVKSRQDSVLQAMASTTWAVGTEMLAGALSG
jgi:hypothetical protein